MTNLENLIQIYSLLHKYKIERSLGILNKETKNALCKSYTITLCGKYDPTFHIVDENIPNLLENIQYMIEDCLHFLRIKGREEELQYLDEELEVC